MELHLASMENITCWAFRKLCQGATDSFTGIMSTQYLIQRNKAWKEVDTFQIQGQRQWLQMATSKESECKEFLKRLEKELAKEPEKQHLYGLQLNLSCPSPQVVGIGQGAALIKRPAKVASLVKELLKQGKFKISIKTRLGLNYSEVQEKKIVALFQEIEKISDPNFEHISVHFKNAREDSFTPYDYSLLKDLTKFKIPVIVNGGIKEYNDFLKLGGKRKNIVGLMIGRQALQNPDCFVEMSNELNKTKFKSRSLEEINSEFKKLCQEHMPREIYLKKIKDCCSWVNDSKEII